MNPGVDVEELRDDRHHRRQRETMGQVEWGPEADHQLFPSGRPEL